MTSIRKDHNLWSMCRKQTTNHERNMRVKFEDVAFPETKSKVANMKSVVAMNSCGTPVDCHCHIAIDRTVTAVIISHCCGLEVNDLNKRNLQQCDISRLKHNVRGVENKCFVEEVALI